MASDARPTTAREAAHRGTQRRGEAPPWVLAPAPPALARRYVLSVCSKLSEGMTHDADEAARWLQVRARGHVCA